MKALLPIMLGLVAIALTGTTSADQSDPHVFSYQFPVTYNPIGIAVDSNEDLWISVTDPAHKIEKYDKNGNLLVSIGLPFAGLPLREYHFSQPRGIAVDSHNDVYVADFDPGRIQKYDSNGNFLLMWGWGVATGADQFEICHVNCRQRRAPSSSCAAGDVPWPYGVEVDILDRVWVRADCNRVQVFDHLGNFLFAWPDGTSVTFSRGWLALDSDTNVYITHSDQIHKFNSAGTLLTAWSKVAATPVEVDKRGDVYVVANWIQGFWKYDSDGDFLVNFGRDPLFNQPSDLAFGADNTLYAVDRHNALVKVFVPLYETQACSGFEPPMANYPVTVKKNRALPLKAQVSNADGFALTGTDIAALPVLQILYDSGLGGEPMDVTDDALSAGMGTEGNQFVFTDEGYWQFNLVTKNYSAPGTYIVTMESGDDSEYVFDPTCVTEYVIQ